MTNRDDRKKYEVQVLVDKATKARLLMEISPPNRDDLPSMSEFIRECIREKFERLDAERRTMGDTRAA